MQPHGTLEEHLIACLLVVMVLLCGKVQMKEKRGQTYLQTKVYQVEFGELAALQFRL